jgi:3-oxoacyl-(acyl-carrier-protein) synthase
MSYYPIKLDKERNLRYGMKAISLIEKKFKKPVMKIEGMQNPESFTMEDYATIIWAGLVHEDDKLTPNKVMELIDEYSSMYDVTKQMWEAFNEAFKDEETDGKSEKNE